MNVRDETSQATSGVTASSACSGVRDHKRSVILASMSPRRAELMREHGYTFEVVAPTIDEPTDLDRDVPPVQYAEALSYFKARSVASTLDSGLIVAADTIAASNGTIFGKPIDRDDAAHILRRLVDTDHDVITGVTLLDAATGRRNIRHDITHITMRQMSDDELNDYLDTNQWQGKAGAYGIQDHGDQFVERIEGSFTNVVGLPMELLAVMIHEWDEDI